MENQPFEITSDELLFFHHRPAVLPLYLELRKQLFSLPGTTLSVQKTQLSFSAPKGYCILSHPRSQSKDSSLIQVSLSSAEPVEHPLLLVNTPIRAGRWTCHLLIRTPEDITAIWPLIMQSYHQFAGIAAK